MTIFAAKLQGLPATVTLAADIDVERLSRSLMTGRGKIVYAIGSGGSAVCAEYFAHCRASLGYGPTIVQTPMELVLANVGLESAEVWLFSAGADNPDIAAALDSARALRAASIKLVTVRSDGATTLKATSDRRCDVHILPVADPSDGFLATHSMVATITALLLAANLLCERPDENLLARFELAVSAAVGDDARATAAAAFSRLQGRDLLLLLHDPNAQPAAVLIETSLWETAVCAVQRTDFRNFAHGRHVWLAKRHEETHVVAMTSTESREIWGVIDTLLPPEVRRSHLDLGNAGRFRSALAIIEGLVVVEAAGLAVGIDPARPGAGPFAKPIYEDRSLETLSSALTPAVRHKWAAVRKEDPAGDDEAGVCSVGKVRLEQVATATFKGIVLDYDGTVVATDDRLADPGEQIVSELVRLIEGGLAVAFATGRGGSIGKVLRRVIPSQLHAKVLVGYYNGGHIRTLDIDIEHDQPPQDADILEVADWIDAGAALSSGGPTKRGRMQLSLKHDDLTDPVAFAKAVVGCEPLAAGRLRLLSSHHSFDIIPHYVTKKLVVRRLRETAGSDAAILCVGDSGSPLGNDNELLSGRHGISVGTVCGRMAGGWTLFGAHSSGPEALLRILSSMTVDVLGGARLDIASLVDRSETRAPATKGESR